MGLAMLVGLDCIRIAALKDERGYILHQHLDDLVEPALMTGASTDKLAKEDVAQFSDFGVKSPHGGSDRLSISPYHEIIDQLASWGKGKR